MQCPQCRYTNPANTKFCGECGTRLESVCAACRAPNPAANKFCGECGQPLAAAVGAPAAMRRRSPASPLAVGEPAIAGARRPGDRFASPETYTPKHLAEKILTSRGAIEGERKQVTVLFTDVSGFTAISERLDPEDVHTIMDRTFEVILGAVHRYEGTINQFLGDGVMALFGAPIAHEDHPHRALRAALAIQNDLEAIRADVRRAHGVEFRLRMGINTGLVVVGAIGRDLRMDYTAVGDTTNLAARLLAIAQPGQIVVSERIRQLTDGFFVLQDLGEFSVKGKSAPVRALAVTQELRGRTRLEVSRERGLTPLVGRHAELKRLEGAYDRAAAGEGAVVLLSGEPGVGKSRLLYEFLARVANSGAFELETSCLSHGRSMPYHPVIALLRTSLGVTDATSESDVRERLRRALVAADLDDEESRALIAHFLGLPCPEEFLVRLQGPQLKQRTFQLLIRMLVRLSQRRLVEIVVENVHWADESSLEFFAALVDAIPRQRVFLVLSTRPGFNAAWLERPNIDNVVVDGLPAADLTDMIRRVLGVSELSETLLHLVVEKSDGNPLYVEEILRQLRETNALVIEDGRARLESSSVAVPETVHDIIAARVDRLPETMKETLQAASVVGRQFPVELVSMVLEGDVDRSLRQLHDLDFVFVTEREPQLAYAFKHALTQEVVYGSLLERRRRVYHAAIGGGLETLYATNVDEVVELLAYHFGRSAEAEKAVDYALRAAEKAQRRWAAAEAVSHFQAALKRLDTMPPNTANNGRRIDAVVKQAEVNFALGRHAEQVKALEDIRSLIDTVEDPARRAAWYSWAGFLQSLTGARPEVAIAYCSEAVNIARTEDLQDIRAVAECCLCHVNVVAGSLRTAVEAGERALATFEARGNVWWACRTLWGLSMASNAIGDWERGLSYCRRALDYGFAVNDLRLKVAGWWRTGSTHVLRGDPASGLQCCDEALKLRPIPFDEAMIKAVQAYAVLKSGDIEAGTAQLTTAIAWFDRSSLRYTRSIVALWLAEAWLRKGELLSARETAEQVMATSREFGYKHAQGVAARLIGESLLKQDAESAARYLDDALAILEAAGARNDIAKTRVTRAEALRAAGDSAGARALLALARAEFERLGTLDIPPQLAALTTD